MCLYYSCLAAVHLPDNYVYIFIVILLIFTAKKDITGKDTGEGVMENSSHPVALKCCTQSSR